MSHVPRIEVHTCTVQGDLGFIHPSPHSQTEAVQLDSFPATIPGNDPPPYDSIHPRKDAYEPASGTERRRHRFWSRLRRIRSDDGRRREARKRSSSPDTAHNTLAPLSASFADHSHNRGRDTSRETTEAERRRPASATLPATQKFAGDDEFDFPLPGHYSLGVYDYVGNSLSRRSSASLQSLGDEQQPRQHRPTTPTITVTTSETADEPPARGWMSVASRLSTPEPSP